MKLVAVIATVGSFVVLMSFIREFLGIPVWASALVLVILILALGSGERS